MTSLKLLILCVLSLATVAQGRLSDSNKLSFDWVVDPHAADPCTKPGCVNSVKYGYNVVPLNISSAANVVFQEAERPKNVAAILKLEILTQPGCVIQGCTTSIFFGFIPYEDCYNSFMAKVPDQPDGKTALLAFEGVYYETQPAGELYAKFAETNGLDDSSCSYSVQSGYKRWF